MRNQLPVITWGLTPKEANDLNLSVDSSLAKGDHDMRLSSLLSSFACKIAICSSACCRFGSKIGRLHRNVHTALSGYHYKRSNRLSCVFIFILTADSYL